MRMTPLIAGCLLAAALPAFAQNAPSAAAPAAPSAADAPRHACVKPGDFPGNLASEPQKRQYTKDYVAFTECLKKFVSDQQALAEPHMKAANATVIEYNAAVKAYNDEAEKSNKAGK